MTGSPNTAFLQVVLTQDRVSIGDNTAMTSIRCGRPAPVPELEARTHKCLRSRKRDDVSQKFTTLWIAKASCDI